MESDPLVRHNLLYYSYNTIAQTFSGWTLSDIKAMTTRERKYWIQYIHWEKNRINIMKDHPQNG